MELTKEKKLKSVKILDNGIMEIEYSIQILENKILIAENIERITKNISDNLDNEEKKIKVFSDFKSLYPKSKVERLEGGE